MKKESSSMQLFSNVPPGKFTGALAGADDTAFLAAVKAIESGLERGDQTGWEELVTLIRANCPPESGEVAPLRYVNAFPIDQISAVAFIVSLAKNRGVFLEHQRVRYFMGDAIRGGDLNAVMCALSAICGPAEARAFLLLFLMERLASKANGRRGSKNGVGQVYPSRSGLPLPSLRKWWWGGLAIGLALLLAFLSVQWLL